MPGTPRKRLKRLSDLYAAADKILKELQALDHVDLNDDEPDESRKWVEWACVNGALMLRARLCGRLQGFIEGHPPLSRADMPPGSAWMEPVKWGQGQESIDEHGIVEAPAPEADESEADPGGGDGQS